jgi:hypothetical protein
LAATGEIEVEVEFTPEPLVETRPEPLAARRGSSVPPQPLSRTPRIGTLMAPSVRVQAEDLGEVTDSMPAIEEIEPSASPPVLEAQPETSAQSVAPSESEPAPRPEPAASPTVSFAAAAQGADWPTAEVRTPRTRAPRRSELESLLRAFASADGPSEPDLRRELKKIAGLEPTPSASLPVGERPQTRASASLPVGERPQTRASASLPVGERLQTRPLNGPEPAGD